MSGHIPPNRYDLSDDVHIVLTDYVKVLFIQNFHKYMPSMQEYHKFDLINKTA